ncbi:SLC13 family permease [Vulcanococcus limneticus]|uniref:SLC13 family permease n=1 Tax=Vulcanococcus limneticus TaxID=2170428 RepID=UPI00398BC988
MPLPIELLALLAVLVAALVGWLTPAQALAGFGNPATLTVVAMFVLSAAVVRTGALAPVQSFLERHGGNSLSRQLLLLAAVVGPLSAVINNTAVVAMFIPVVERWCRRLGVAPARMLMPLSFMTVMAGVATLLGTSTNLVASSLSEQLGYGSFALLQFTPMALLTYGCGVLLLALLAPWLLPRGEAAERAQQLEAGYAIHDYLSELLVADSSPLVGQRLDDTLLQHTFDVRLLALIRDGERFSLPLGGQVLRGGDLLVVKGRGDRLLALRDQEGLELVPELGAPAPLDLELDAIAEVLVPAGSRLIGLSLREIRFSQRFTSTVLAIRRGEDLLRDRLGQVKLRLGDALLLQTPRATLPALQVSRDLLLLDGAVEQDDRRDRLPWALGVTAAMLVLTLLRSDLLAVWALLAVTVLVMGRVLTPQEVYASVRWDVVVLLAALLPLAQLFSGSGADRWLVSLLAEQVATWPPYALLTALYLTTALVTELVSNQAAVSLMLPLGLSISHGLGVHPFAAMGVMTFAASNSFLTPIGYQTNTMVYSVGGYSFRDFFRMGLPLTLLLALLTPALALWLAF